MRRLPFVYSPSGCAGQCGLLEDSWYFLALAGCGRRCATLFCRVARCVPTSTQRQLRQYGGLDFPHKVLLLTVPGGFYWSVPRESWCSFPLVFSHREQCSELRLCGDNSASGGVVLVLLFVESVQELCVDAVTNCGSCRFSHYFTPSRAVGVDALPCPDGQVDCGGRQHSSPSRIELLS